MISTITYGRDTGTELILSGMDRKNGGPVESKFITGRSDRKFWTGRSQWAVTPQSRNFSAWPWPSSSVSYSVIPVRRGCRSGHLECRNKWNDKLMSVCLSYSLKINKNWKTKLIFALSPVASFCASRLTRLWSAPFQTPPSSRFPPARA